MNTTGHIFITPFPIDGAHENHLDVKIVSLSLTSKWRVQVEDESFKFTSGSAKTLLKRIRTVINHFMVTSPGRGLSTDSCLEFYSDDDGRPQCRINHLVRTDPDAAEGIDDGVLDPIPLPLVGVNYAALVVSSCGPLTMRFIQELPSDTGPDPVHAPLLEAFYKGIPPHVVAIMERTFSCVDRGVPRFAVSQLNGEDFSAVYDYLPKLDR